MADTDSHLQALYPFLYDQNSQDQPQLTAALGESVRHKSDDSCRIKQEFFAKHSNDVVKAASAVADVYRHKGRLFTMGNGGSSCDASHIAVEFLHPVTAGRPALAAVHLAADTAMLTAVGNDVGFRHVFVRQLIAQSQAGDGLIGISTSGNSENLLEAFDVGKKIGLTTVGLAGMDGGQMALSPSVDHCLVVPSDSIHRIQECHVAIYHILWDLVHTLLASERGRVAREDA